MGKPDTVTYDYMKQSEVFADAFNFLLYSGNKVIDSAELKELDTRAIASIYNESKGKKGNKAVHKYRDIFKKAVFFDPCTVYNYFRLFVCSGKFGSDMSDAATLFNFLLYLFCDTSTSRV